VPCSPEGYTFPGGAILYAGDSCLDGGQVRSPSRGRGRRCCRLGVQYQQTGALSGYSLAISRAPIETCIPSCDSICGLGMACAPPADGSLRIPSAAAPPTCTYAAVCTTLDQGGPREEDLARADSHSSLPDLPSDVGARGGDR
jgi:hypothetical protein